MPFSIENYKKHFNIPDTEPEADVQPEVATDKDTSAAKDYVANQRESLLGEYKKDFEQRAPYHPYNIAHNLNLLTDSASTGLTNSGIGSLNLFSRLSNYGLGTKFGKIDRYKSLSDELDVPKERRPLGNALNKLVEGGSEGAANAAQLYGLLSGVGAGAAAAGLSRTSKLASNVAGTLGGAAEIGAVGGAAGKGAKELAKQYGLSEQQAELAGAAAELLSSGVYGLGQATVKSRRSLNKFNKLLEGSKHKVDTGFIRDSLQSSSGQIKKAVKTTGTGLSEFHAGKSLKDAYDQVIDTNQALFNAVKNGNLSRAKAGAFSDTLKKDFITQLGKSDIKDAGKIAKLMNAHNSAYTRVKNSSALSRGVKAAGLVAAGSTSKKVNDLIPGNSIFYLDRKDEDFTTEIPATFNKGNRK